MAESIEIEQHNTIVAMGKRMKELEDTLRGMLTLDEIPEIERNKRLEYLLEKAKELLK